MKKLSTLGLVLVLAVVTLLSAGSAFAKKPSPPPPPPPKECICPDVYAPVICSNGVIYSNLCRAGCAGATNCVPYGDTAATSTEATPTDSPSTDSTEVDSGITDATPADSAITDALARGCLCPLIYAPVTCDNGKTYPNQCEADCHHARNCKPSGTF